MPTAIGTKQGITYYCECRSMASILNPTVDNTTKIRYIGFFDEMWDEYDVGFNNFGYGLKKTRENKGVILCDDASKCFGTTKGYVGMVLNLPHNIRNGVYSILTSGTQINEYLLWGVNVGNINPSYPTIYAKLTTSGIEFTIWTIYGQNSIVDSYSNIYANNNAFYEFVWDANPMDDFSLNDFDASMAIRVNGEDTVLGNPPLGTMSLSGLNFCALDTPKNYYNIECILRKLVLSNEIPTSIEHEWYSSSTSSSSSGLEGDYYYDKLSYNDMSQEPTINLVSYTDVETVGDYLQLTTSSRRFKHMWVPNSNGGNTMSKIDITDTTHPVEVGRYKTAVSGDNPSRTVVVPPGDCWVASRAYGTITKIGLIEASHCRDTCLSTSTGTNELAYGQDDAVLYYFDVESETMKYPTTAPSGSSSIRGLTDDVNGNIWCDSGDGTGTWFKISGDGGLTTGEVVKYTNLLGIGSYGAICSYKNNYIWSVKYPGLTGIDFFSADDPVNTKGTFAYVQSYGISYSRGYVYTGDYTSSPDSTTRRVTRINVDAVDSPGDFPLYATTFTFINCPNTSYFPRHFAILANEDAVVDANRTEDLYINWYGSGTAGFLGVIRNHKQYADGENIEIDFQTTEKYQLSHLYPTGVGVMYDTDNNPFVWVLNSSGTNIQAFDPSVNQMITFYTGNNYIPVGKTLHYNYTNFTGTVDENDVYPVSGTAIYIIDGFYTDRWWSEVCLTENIPTNSSLTISGSSSNNPNVFSRAIEFDNCSDISSHNFVGRYFRLILQFNRVSQSDSSPTVRDIEVKFVD